MSDSTLVAAVKAAATPAAAPLSPPVSREADMTAARDEGFAAGEAQGVKKGASAERARIAAILDHASANGRAGLARHFAFATDMTPEAAHAALSAAPAESPPVKTNRLDALAPNPNVDADPPTDAVDPKASWDPIVADLNATLKRGR